MEQEREQITERASELRLPNPNLVVVLYYVTRWLPFVISGISIYLGYRLFILGVTGKASLVVNAHTISGQLLNAAPGLFFAVGGLVSLMFAVWKGGKIRSTRHEFCAKAA